MPAKTFIVRGGQQGVEDLEGVIFSNGRAYLSDGQMFAGGVAHVVQWIKANWPKYVVEVDQEEIFK